ncbi:hypothetical protein [Micromonospora sp. NPDC005087]|uniref:hypothetical protein n=1 Tax=Micromonospora sp. NPDC005087 TaxID=3364225 RepID=UPI0036BB7AD9
MRSKSSTLISGSCDWRFDQLHLSMLLSWERPRLPTPSKESSMELVAVSLTDGR